MFKYDPLYLHLSKMETELQQVRCTFKTLSIPLRFAPESVRFERKVPEIEFKSYVVNGRTCWKLDFRSFWMLAIREQSQNESFFHQTFQRYTNCFSEISQFTPQRVCLLPLELGEKGNLAGINKACLFFLLWEWQCYFILSSRWGSPQRDIQ